MGGILLDHTKEKNCRSILPSDGSQTAVMKKETFI
jgi:hypothetical protein